MEHLKATASRARRGKAMEGRTAGGIGVVLIVIIVALALFFILFPGTVFRAAQYVNRSLSGLSDRSVQVDDNRIVYLEGGKGETVLLLHGYSADKDNWTAFSKYLTPKYRVVIPDIPGFGESSRRQEASYDIESQVERLHRFVQVMRLGKVNVAGNSMGGTIAAVYAAKYPQEVSSLALLAPGGIQSGVKSEVMKMFEKGVNPLAIKSDQDFDRMMNLAFVKAPTIPYPVRKALVARAIKDGPFNEKVMADMIRKPISLESYLSLVKAKTLILWGDRDNIVDVSCVPIIEKRIKNHQTVIIKDCGHMPMLERPEETAGYYLKFLQGDAGQK